MPPRAPRFRRLATPLRSTSWLRALAVVAACAGCAPADPSFTTGAGSGGSSTAGSGGGGGSVSVSGSGGVPGTGLAPGGSGGSAGTGGTGGAGGVTSPGVGLIGDVAFSTPSQTFRDQIDVGMSTTIAGAEIRYTTNGQLPGPSSTLYSGSPVRLTATTQLRAQPFVAGSAGGRVSTAIYIARTFDATSDLPIVVVDGYGTGKPTNKDVYVDAAVMIFEPVAGTASLAALPTVAARAGYHIRGQSSANFPQAPYKVELWDNANADLDYPILGMPSDSDWALIAPYYDRALIRNPFVYGLGRDIGLQAPRLAYAEVYINYEARALAAGDYQGIYWLTETIKNNTVRTNLKQLRETDTVLPQISGGYIFKFDQAASEEPKLTCTGSSPISGGVFGMGGRGGGGRGGSTGTCWVDLEVVDPEPLIDPQKAWLTDYIQQFHNALHTTPIGDYAAFIDVPSFIDYMLVNELTRNVDSYVRSAYYFKERDGKLKAGPLWDYNFSLAVGGATTLDPAGGWHFQATRNVNNWYPKLSADAPFMTAAKARWRELRQTVLTQAAVEERIATLTAPLRNAAPRDLAKWPVSSLFRAGTGFVRGPTVETWEGQVQAMRDFIIARAAWMDTQLQ